ncbi:phage tail protein [Nocardia sp. CDC153]|uniref:phage tail protein n=1 Tax=Nocardia sp. CDC153 TaxID=3112167 RepID=UPI002DB5CA51|nr:phage tail protein [Nocardia sp. CDC153]MEC3955805.1 phage tail protein [Nocardia sp. CDC153]
MAPSPALITISGVDGSTWTISGQGRGREGVELGTAPSGLYDAPVTTIWNATAFQNGSTYGGYSTNKRDVVFGVNIFQVPGRSWEQVDSAWRKAWAYDTDSVMTVTTDYGSRSLALRLTEQPDFKPVKDPHLNALGQVTMTCSAGVPWWVENNVTSTWTSPTDTTNGSSQSGTVTISNPTDQPMYLQWVCSAPGQWTLPDFSWGNNYYGRAVADANRKITMPVTRAGQDLVVDTDPSQEMVVAADGSQIWALMGGVSFEYVVPPYTPSTVLPVKVTGAPTGASVMVVQPRNWSRPWGLQ